MNRILVAAAVVAAALFAAGPSTAEAKTSVVITIGSGGHWGIHHNAKRPHYKPVRHVLPRRQIVRLMAHRGYSRCAGWQMRNGVYSLRCVRHGRTFAVRVNAWNGHIIGLRRIG